MDPKFSTSLTFWALFLWGPLQNHGRKMAARATVFRDTDIRDSSWRSRDVTDMMLSQMAESSAAALYP